MTPLAEQFGNIDIYLFDQILRGRIAPGARVFDAGCGGGRNLVWLARNGHAVFGNDADPRAIQASRRVAPAGDFRVEAVEASSFESGSADVAICSAVLHFARDDAQFDAMLRQVWRVLRGGGLFFARLASTIGMEGQARRIAGRRYALPDGSERYLVDEELLMRTTAELGGALADPLKTTVVQNQRAMTTWVVFKA
jgi:SAM-dependent methyltransferase